MEQLRNSSQLSINQRIVGGQRTEIKEFPWQVGLAVVSYSGSLKSYNFICGGAILRDETHVISRSINF